MRGGYLSKACSFVCERLPNFLTKQHTDHNDGSQGAEEIGAEAPPVGFVDARHQHSLKRLVLLLSKMQCGTNLLCCSIAKAGWA